MFQINKKPNANALLLTKIPKNKQKEKKPTNFKKKPVTETTMLYNLYISIKVTKLAHKKTPKLNK